jgi:hypothetical protein
LDRIALSPTATAKTADSFCNAFAFVAGAAVKPDSHAATSDGLTDATARPPNTGSTNDAK